MLVDVPVALDKALLTGASYLASTGTLGDLVGLPTRTNRVDVPSRALVPAVLLIFLTYPPEKWMMRSANSVKWRIKKRDPH